MDPFASLLDESGVTLEASGLIVVSIWASSNLETVTEVDLYITDMAITELQMDGLIASTEPGKDMLSLILGDSDLQLTFDWRYEEIGFPFIKDHGTGTASVTGLSGSMLASVDVPQDCGKMVMTFEDFQCDIGKIEIDLDGGASALYDLVLNTFITLMESLFADELSDMIEESLYQCINDGLMKETNYSEDGFGVDFDMRPVAPGVTIMDSYIGILSTGYMFPSSVGPNWDGRTKPSAPLPDIVNNADTQLIMSNNLFNTMFSAANYNDALSGTISPETVGNPMYDSYLTTSVLGGLCPEVYTQYPDSSVSLELSASVDPFLSFMPSAGYLNITGTVDVSVNSDPASD
eukprot:g5875.t1